MEQILAFVVNLKKIPGNGDFQCLKCGSNISPDDKTDKIYCILEPKVVDNNLTELIIQCKKCKSQIRITGF